MNYFSYKAVFSTGDEKSIKRGTRLYSAAYLVIVEFEGGRTQKWMGFAKSRKNASGAILSETAWATGNSRSRFARLTHPNKNIGKIIHNEVIDVVPQHAV